MEERRKKVGEEENKRKRREKGREGGRKRVREREREEGREVGKGGRKGRKKLSYSCFQASKKSGIAAMGMKDKRVAQ